MTKKRIWWGMIAATVILGVGLTSCWSTGKARQVVPVAAVTLQRVRSTIMPDVPMQIFVDNVPHELANSETTSFIVNNGEHMVYAVLGDYESESIRFTTNSRTMVVNVAPKKKLIALPGKEFDLTIEVGEAQ